MSPFKFRVWHYPSKTWVSTDIVLYHDGEVDMCTAYQNLDITDNEDFEISYSTGLFDSSDKEIYFEDILYFYDINNERCCGVVEFEDSIIKLLNFNVNNASRNLEYMLDNYNCYILGNKYQNKELINE